MHTPLDGMNDHGGASAGRRLLVSGPTGYVGGRLVSRLVRGGYQVRCLARRPDRLRGRAPSGVEIVQGDVQDRESLERALVGVDRAYYLVHSMGGRGGFEAADRQAARNFGDAALSCGVEVIIYLGGLGDPAAELSPHLRSRQEVGEVLRASGVPVIELRASIIIGSGSLSFEIVRALVERLPIMVTPRWVDVPAQPIGIEDALSYLEACASLDIRESRIFEIGGADVVSYRGLMQEYARQRHLRRWMIPVPFLTPRLSSLWLGLVTPVYATVGRKLIDSIRHPTVVRNPDARRVFDVEPVGIREAISRALDYEDADLAETRWVDSYSRQGQTQPWGGQRLGNRLVDVRSALVPASPSAVFRVIERIGGATGWYYGQPLWILRGWIDLLCGGVGMRRGRRDPVHLNDGDVVDCWRVEAIQPGRSLRLAAEMKLPGQAWLSFDVGSAPDGAAVVRQTATFDPQGLAGLIYWYGVWPLHQLVFAGMLRGIGRRAVRTSL